MIVLYVGLYFIQFLSLQVKKIILLLKEYLCSQDVTEASRCLLDLEVSDVLIRLFWILYFCILGVHCTLTVHSGQVYKGWQTLFRCRTSTTSWCLRLSTWSLKVRSPFLPFNWLLNKSSRTMLYIDIQRRNGSLTIGFSGMHDKTEEAMCKLLTSLFRRWTS